MYSKTESEISLANKMKQSCDTSTPDGPQGCVGRRTLLEKILFFTVICLVTCILGLILAIVFQDKSIFRSSSDSASNLQRSTFYYSHNPKWINRPVHHRDEQNREICVSKGCVDAASEVLAKLDPSVDPCEDFYQFACGGYTSTAVIADDKGQVSEFSQLNDKLTQQVRQLLSDPAPLPPSSPFHLARSAYLACMNKQKIEMLGLSPLTDILAKLGGWPVVAGPDWSAGSEWSWQSLIYRLRALGLGTDFLINFSVSTDLRDSNRHVMSLDQPELGLAREFLLKGEKDPVVQAYTGFMIEVATMLGAEPSFALQSMLRVLQFETALANISLSREVRRDPNRQYNPMAVSEIASLDPDTPWLEYINTILGPENAVVTGEDMVVVNVPQYVSSLSQLLRETPSRVVTDFVLWRIAASSLSYLNERAEMTALKFTMQLTGQAAKPARWQKCSSEVTGALGPLVGSLYVQKYFSSLSKAEAVDMVDQIRGKFLEVLEDVDWMDAVTRERAKDKALAMVEYIGYTPELRDMEKLTDLYRGLQLSQDSYVGNGFNISRYHRNYAFSKLRQPVNKKDWVRHGNPAIVNAFYSPIENSIQIPAGILQGVFFNSNRPKYMNYGAIGWVIGHEITHGFDDQGRRFDKEGNLVNWWDEKTAARYVQKAQCMVEQYSHYNYPHLDNITVNGVNTLGENIADNGGIMTSYRAYESWAARHGPEPLLPGLNFSPSQLFWISAANVWCAKHRPGDLKMSVLLGTHTPANYRIRGTFSNLPEFSEAFQCRKGSKMNPSTSQKCQVW